MATTVAMTVAVPVTVVLSVPFVISTDVCGWANAGPVIMTTAAATRKYWIFIAVLLAWMLAHHYWGNIVRCKPEPWSRAPRSAPAASLRQIRSALPGLDVLPQFRKG